MAHREYFDVRVTGTPEQNSSFIQLCKTIEAICKTGNLRTIWLVVDGLDSLEFDFNELDITRVEIPELGQDDIRIAIE